MGSVISGIFVRPIASHGTRYDGSPIVFLDRRSMLGNDGEDRIDLCRLGHADRDGVGDSAAS
jgi:hypothetical protein